ncbi:uncharacterized protein LOC141532430 [Cotesia typhae]
MRAKKQNWTLFALAAVLIACLVVGVFMLLKVKAREDETTAKIRKAMNVPQTSVHNKNHDLAEQYVNNINDLLTTVFAKWNSDSEALTELSLFAINLMEFVIANGEQEIPSYMSVVRKIVESLKNELKNKPFTKTRIPWGENWFPFSVHVTRLFILFQYYGNDTALGYECHKQIIRIIPEIGISLRPLSRPHKKLNLFYMTVSRLCSNYMYDIAQYEKDIQTTRFQELKEYLLFKPMNTYVVNEGFYKDDSCIYSENVASYALLKLYDNFHDRVYRALGFTTGLSEAATRLLPKILHPKIKAVPLGLFGRTGDLISYRQYPLIFQSTGIFIAPFIGFGVFKTNDILFYVRVQRPNIVAYQIKKGEGSKDLALGWVQMRKIYHLRDTHLETYKKEMTWNTLKEQPGLLTFKDHQQDNNDPNIFKEDEVEEFQGFWSENVNSFIGQVNENETEMDKKLLFWRNSYKFYKAYKNKEVAITEVAVVTSKGIQAHYEINNQSKEDLRFNYKDLKYDWQIMSVNDSNTEPFHTVPKDTSKFKWKMLTEKQDYKVNFESDTMSFKFLEKNYTVKVKDKNERYELNDGTNSKIFYAKPT